MSLPSFVNDVAEAFAEFVNEQSYQFAATGRAKYPLVAPEGGKEALQAQMTEFTMGSDHQVYTDSSWKIPAIYLNDWPDRYIHTNFDTPAMIDPTKLKRAAFIGAASGYFLAQMTEQIAPEILWNMRVGSTRRIAKTFQRQNEVSDEEWANLYDSRFEYEGETIESVARFASLPHTETKNALNWLSALRTGMTDVLPIAPTPSAADALLIFQRNPQIKGPMSVFGYDYFEDKHGEERAKKLKLLQYQGLRASGGEYAYEVLNFADGKRNAQQIRDAVSAEYGPVPLEAVVEYLKALEEIGVVKRVKL